MMWMEMLQMQDYWWSVWRHLLLVPGPGLVPEPGLAQPASVSAPTAE